MTGCVGFDLRSRDGVCIVRMNLNPKMHDFKLYIDTSDNENNVKISGFVPNSVLAQNENFGELVIVNEKIKQRFIINKGLVEGAGFIEQANFPLHSNIALGNVLRVYSEKAGEMVLLGDCAISLQDPNINETQYYAENYNNIEDKVKFDLRMVLLAVLGLLFLLMGLFMIRVIRMQRKLREELGSRGTIIPDSAVATGEGQGTHKHVEFVESEDIEAEV